MHRSASLKRKRANTPERGILLECLYSILREEKGNAWYAHGQIADVVSKEALCALTPFLQHLQCSILSCSVCVRGVRIERMQLA